MSGLIEARALVSRPAGKEHYMSLVGSLDESVPSVHPEAWVAPGAVVVGRVTLGQGETFGDLRIDWMEDDAVLAGVTSGRGLGEMSGIEIEEYNG